MGARRPSAARPQPCPLSHLGRSAPKPRRWDGPKRASGSCILQRETLLRQQTTASPCLGAGNQHKLFLPRPSALHRAKRGWAAPGSLGPAALLGVSSTRITLPTGSPSWGSRIGCAKAFCAQAPAMPPEPPRPLNPEAPSLGRPKTSFWELHSAKGNSPPAANHTPNAPWLRKAVPAIFPPGPALSIVRCGAGLPMDPWALLLCWGFPAPESHCPRVLLRGEAGLGARRPSAPRPQPCPLSQLGRSAPRPRRSDGT